MDRLDDLIFAAAVEQPAKAALVTPRRRLTFGELAQDAEAIARRLGAGDHRGAVALRLQSKADMLRGFLGTLRSGRPAFPLDLALPQAQRDGFIRDLRPEFLMTMEEAGLSIVKTGYGGQSHRRAAPDDFYWGLSSGTTGRPKAFARSHASWLASIAACETVFPFAADDVIALPGALTHSLFLYGAVHGLTRGLTLAAVEAFHPAAALRHFEAEGATALFAVPSMLAAMLASGFGGFRPRLIFSGGARLTPSLRSAVEAALPDADLIEFYGTSELSFVTYASTSKPAPERSVGRVFPGVDLRIASGEAGCGGLIEVRSPLLFSGYLADEDRRASGPAETGGWASGGDLGHLDTQGFLFLDGRRERIINSKGLKIAAEAVEDMLCTLAGVEAAAVIGLPDPRRGEAISAVIVPRRGVSGQKLLTECRSALPQSHRPRRIFLAESLPRTASGKIAAAELRARLTVGDAHFRELGG
jgi:long-chain acyl-CoA synthetase